MKNLNIEVSIKTNKIALFIISACCFLKSKKLINLFGKIVFFSVFINGILSKKVILKDVV